MKSTDIVQPQPMSSAFAEDVFSASGSTDFAIPDATSSSATDTCVLDDGFLPITSDPLPPDGDGIAPARKNFNGLFYLSTDQRVFLQNGGVITYDANVATSIGGYPQGAILSYIDTNGNLHKVKSLIDDNQYNFVTTPSYIDGSKWDFVYDTLSTIEILKQIYPIGSIYIGTMSSCPFAAFFGTWTLIAEDRVLQGSSSNHIAGSTIAAGLPGITGEISLQNQSFGSPTFSGAFTSTSWNRTNNSGDGGTNSGLRKVSFNASNSSSIYGNSNTVQPSAYVVNIWRRTA